MKEIIVKTGDSTYTTAMVDDEDYGFITLYQWTMSGGYPCAKIWGSWRAMHRVLIRYIPGREVIDHADRNALNNQKSNLRIATQAENGWNRGASKRNKIGLKGVCLCKKTGRYIAKIMANGKCKHIGRFDTPEQAHAAYLAVAENVHGPYAFRRTPPPSSIGTTSTISR